MADISELNLITFAKTLVLTSKSSTFKTEAELGAKAVFEKQLGAGVTIQSTLELIQTFSHRTPRLVRKNKLKKNVKAEKISKFVSFL